MVSFPQVSPLEPYTPLSKVKILSVFVKEAARSVRSSTKHAAEKCGWKQIVNKKLGFKIRREVFEWK